MKFKPLGKRVLVKLNETKKQTSKGIFIPDTIQQSEFSTGIVISVGSDVLNIKENDNIMFSSSIGIDIEVEGESLKLIPDESFVDAII